MKTEPKLFCQKYYEHVRKYAPIKLKPDYKCGMHVVANSYLLGIVKNPPDWVTTEISEADYEFRYLVKPIKKQLTLYRGIANPQKYPELKNNKFLNNKFMKCTQSKFGDTIYMPEFAFASDKNYIALEYSKNDIVYKINVPAGSKIYKHIAFEYIFPRASKFICKKNSIIKNKNGETYRLIELDYVLPPNRNSSQNQNIFSRIYNKIFS